jgi:enterochelin esterase-like enzyme
MLKHILLGLILLYIIPAFGQQDLTHFSKVFNAEKPYRVYLPSDYSTSTRRYPVIYYFHGNKGNHKLQYDSLTSLLKNAGVIVVAWNGRSVEKDDRPYNIGFHSNINYKVQFKDYFLEFVQFIDGAYRTIPDREHRAVFGHSMGGFMSFFLAGKYPQLIGTAVNAKGSAEFFAGYPENHNLYSFRYLFKNYHGVRLRFHIGSPREELVHLNKEVLNGALREKDLDFTYKFYPGPHDISFPEWREGFEFIINSFKNPLPVPKRWSHIDSYADFNVWGYDVKSNLHQPGFIEMRGVTKGGLEITTKKWEPDGRTIPGVNIKVTTAPLYQPRTSYVLVVYNEIKKTKTISDVMSDENGRISFEVDHEPHQIGIHRAKEPADVVLLNYKVNDNSIFLDAKKESSLKLHLLNRGGNKTGPLKIALSTAKKNVTIANPVIETSALEKETETWVPIDFKVTASNEPETDGSPFRVRFDVVITDKNGNSWREEFDAPVFYDVPAFNDIGIDDGDSEIFGSGDGDNVAEPGETVMIYQHSNRTRLFYDDPYVDGEKLYDELQPDKWGDGYALSSLIHISKDAPIGHKIRFLAYYEIKEWKTIKRNLTWGSFTITVGKEDISSLPENEKTEYNGRIGFSDTACEIYWPGSSVKTRFKGTGVKAVLRCQRQSNFFNVIIDGNKVDLLKVDSIKKTYTLAEGLPDGEHTVDLYRRTDFGDGVIWFYGFEYPDGAEVLDVPPKKRMMEFYGNSITVGSANEDEAGNSGRGTHTNNYLSYGAITARHFDARYACISRSGIGLMVSWSTPIMPEIYYRLNPFDKESRWDFSKARPDIVVVNLLQNDAALFEMPEYDQFKSRFGAKAPVEDTIVARYKDFISVIRNKYPSAHIICALGSMGAVKPGSPWPGYIEKAVSLLNDKKIYTLFFPYINVDRHPNVEEHKKMADQLIGFIEKNIKW